jgi:hypothetical protein
MLSPLEIVEEELEEFEGEFVEIVEEELKRFEGEFEREEIIDMNSLY